MRNKNYGFPESYFFLTEFTDSTSPPKQIQSCSIKLWMSELVFFLSEEGPKNYNRINHLAKNLRLIKSIFYAQWTKIRKIKWKFMVAIMFASSLFLVFFVCFFIRFNYIIWCNRMCNQNIYLLQYFFPSFSPLCYAQT